MANSAQAKNVNDTWRVIEEPRELVDSTGSSGYIVDGVTRDSDGFTMTQEAAGFMGDFQTFLCKGNFGQFEFEASRRNSSESPPLDTYSVLAYGYKDKSVPDMIHKYAKDIVSALLAYPTSRLFDYMPVKHVKFDIGDYNYRRAEEL